MKLIELGEEGLTRLYQKEMTRDFPPQELKPLKAMLELMAQGRYQALGLYEGEELLGYALVWREPGVPFVLLDYLGTLPGVRNRGLGGQLLDLLAHYYREERGIFGEAESDEGGADADRELRRRRLGFYLRHGFRYGGYDCALFGVHYQTLIRGREDVTPEELLKVHRSFYQNRFPAHIYKRFVQLPLAPGEAPNPPGNWTEE